MVLLYDLLAITIGADLERVAPPRAPVDAYVVFLVPYVDYLSH